MMEPLAASRNAPRLFVGMVVIALGTLALLDNLNIIQFDEIWSLWPLLLVAFGLARILRPAGQPGRFMGTLLLILGGWLLLQNLGLAPFRLGVVFWPLLLVLLGLRLVWGAFGGRLSGPPPDGTARLSAFAMLGGSEHKSNSADFRGGDATAILGGCKIDLRQASIKNGPAVLETFAMWGGIEIIVPRGWGVVVQATPIMGAYEDKTSPPPEGTGPQLVVKGAVIMGGVEIKNKD
jgi:predicted membrane protein